MTVSPLRLALGEHLGQVLTPELACALEQAAFSVPDDSLNPTQFGSIIQHGYVIQVERFSEIQDELHVLHELHWLETEGHRHGLSMNPDYAKFIQRERTGTLIQFTLRKDGELVGNMRLYINTSIHTQTRYASEDTLFIKPEHRGGMLAITLMRFAEQCLFSLGIREIRTSTKMVNRSDVLMRRLDYAPVAIEFVKFLKD